MAEEPEKMLQNNLMSNNNNNPVTYSKQMSDNISVVSSNTNKTDRTGMTQMTNQTGFTAVTYATQMLGNLVYIEIIPSLKYLT